MTDASWIDKMAALDVARSEQASAFSSSEAAGAAPNVASSLAVVRTHYSAPAPPVIPRGHRLCVPGR
jgi:hypothetical protein